MRPAFAAAVIVLSMPVANAQDSPDAFRDEAVQPRQTIAVGALPLLQPQNPVRTAVIRGLAASEQVDFVLARAGALEGHLIDERGAPVTGATVRMMRRVYLNGQPRLVVAGDAGGEMIASRLLAAAAPAGEMAHAADLEGGKYLHIECVDVDRVLKDGTRLGVSDEHLVERGGELFDALFEFLRGNT